MNETTNHPFIDHLQSLVSKEERGALAALRRGLGRPPGTAPELYRYVEPYLPQKCSRSFENACYLIASLFAMHPETTTRGNLGSHLALTRSEAGDDALERRFTALLSAHPEDLPEYLRHSISFLKSKDQPVNWNQLFWDLQHWDNENQRVQKEWARAFWGRPQAGEENQDQ
jgi:CRISPR system Cascade subunit CasB